MSDTIDAHDIKHATATHASERRPAHGAGHSTSGGDRRVIDLDAMTDTVRSPAGAEEEQTALPPVRDTSYYLG